MKRKFIMSILCCLPLYAHAKWETTLDPAPDVDLDDATMSGTENMKQSIVVYCEEGMLNVSYIEPHPQQPDERMDSYKTFSMQLKTEQEKLDFTELDFERLNSEYITFSALNDLETRHAVYMLSNAKGPITMSVKVGNQVSGVTMSSAGAKKAAAKMAKACGVDFSPKSWKDLKQ